MTSATSQAETTVDDGRTGRSYLSGGLLVAGGVWALVGNVLHPRFDQQNQAAVYRAVHIQSDRLLFADLLLILATLLITAGLLELARALSRRHASALARIGGAAVAIGGGIAVVQYVVEAYGLRQGAHLFAIVDYRNQMGAFWATSAVDWINTGKIEAPKNFDNINAIWEERWLFPSAALGNAKHFNMFLDPFVGTELGKGATECFAMAFR